MDVKIKGQFIPTTLDYEADFAINVRRIFRVILSLVQSALIYSH